MTATIKPRRIVFLDLLRALAVMMMVEGHTIDVLLFDEYRSYDYPGFKLWQFTRGMTAPIFLLTAGTVFIYLLRSTALPFRDNPRVAKGVKRALLLFALGYLLRFPSPSIIGVFSAPDEQWRAFWTVDVVPLPRSQDQAEGLLVEVSVSCTVSGAVPLSGEAVNPETGTGAGGGSPSARSACQYRSVESFPASTTRPVLLLTACLVEVTLLTFSELASRMTGSPRPSGNTGSSIGALLW